MALANADTGRTLKASEDSRIGLVDYVKVLHHRFPSAAFRRKLERLDNYYHRSAKVKKGSKKDKGTQREVTDASRYEDLELEIVQPNADADFAHYVDTFLTSNPIFQVVSSADNMEAAQMMQTIIENEQKEFQWVKNLTRCFKDAAKYNIIAAEVSWVTRTETKVVTDLENTERNESGVETVEWQGNQIKHINPYNAFWDTSVLPADVAAEGLFAGYTEKMTHIALRKYIEELKTDKSSLINTSPELWTTVINKFNFYFEPNIMAPSETVEVDNPVTDWDAEFNAAVTPDKYVGSKNYYYVTRVYVRIIPEMMGLAVPEADKVQIFKLVIVNEEFLLQAEKITNSHNLLPMILGQPVEDEATNLSTRSPAERSISYQEHAHLLVKRHMAILDKEARGRKAFNSNRVKSEDINTVNGDGNIPINLRMNERIGDHIADLGGNFSGWNEINNSIAMIRDFAQESAGINKPQRGQFMRGNKTLGEYQDVMSNAGSNQFARAQLIEASFLSNIKTIVKTNILEFQPTVKLLSTNNRQEIEVDPVTLRETALEFKLADGLNPSTRLVRAGGLEYLLQVWGMLPQLGQEYNLAKAASKLIQQGYGVNLEEFKLTPEEQEQQRQRALQQEQQDGNTNQQG
jgi:hypothetical protein